MKNSYKIDQPEPKILTRKEQIIHGIIIAAWFAVVGLGGYMIMWGAFG